MTNRAFAVASCAIAGEARLAEARNVHARRTAPATRFMFMILSSVAVEKTYAPVQRCEAIPLNACFPIDADCFFQARFRIGCSMSGSVSGAIARHRR